MRLPADYVAAIKEAARETFGDGAVMRLFTRKSDPSARDRAPANAGAQGRERNVRGPGLLPAQEHGRSTRAHGTLAHDYPTRAAAPAERARLASLDLPDLIAGTRRTLSHLRSEELIS